MASSSHQQGNGHFTSNSPYFFKIILQDTIQKGKLGMPRKFVKDHGDSMSNPAMLRVPAGAVWKVELIKCDGKIWLEKGWLEFSNHYALEFGHFLVFRYDGNSNFHVLIFNKSASEIQYPYTSNNDQPSNEIPEQIINESEDDDSKNILQNISLCRKMREKSQSHLTRPHKMMRSTNSTIKTECSWNSEFLHQQVSHNGCPARKGDKSTNNYAIQYFEKVKALKRARVTFKSKNPFFLVVMQPSCVGLNQYKRYTLVVPVNFAEKHLMKGHCSVSLCSSSEKTWIVTYRQRYVKTWLYSYLQNGWRTFVRDNNIQLGDVCAFELINSIELAFKVVIYKDQDANRHQSLASTDVLRPVKRKLQGSPQRLSLLEKAKASTDVLRPVKQKLQGSPPPLSLLKKAKVFKKAIAFKSENPFFVIILRRSYVDSSSLSIPANFASQYLIKMHKQVISLISKGKSWAVIYYQHNLEKQNVVLGKGWRKFAEDNDLEVGDACAFELIAETSMQVTIYKKQPVHDANPGSSLDDTSKEKLVEVDESLAIKTEESARMKGKGVMSDLPTHYSCDATGEIFDDRSGPSPPIHRTEWF